jgi:hypothetical protein
MAACGRYRVQTFKRDTGAELWVTIEACGKADAIDAAARTGAVVGNVLLDEIVERPGNAPTDAQTRAWRNADSAALVVAALGLVVAPLAVAGAAWGHSVKQRSAGRYGGAAVTVGLGVLGLWLIGLAIVIVANGV